MPDEVTTPKNKVDKRTTESTVLSDRKRARLESTRKDTAAQRINFAMFAGDVSEVSKDPGESLAASMLNVAHASKEAQDAMEEKKITKRKRRSVPRKKSPMMNTLSDASSEEEDTKMPAKNDPPPKKRRAGLPKKFTLRVRKDSAIVEDSDEEQEQQEEDPDNEGSDVAGNSKEEDEGQSSEDEEEPKTQDSEDENESVEKKSVFDYFIEQNMNDDHCKAFDKDNILGDLNHQGGLKPDHEDFPKAANLTNNWHHTCPTTEKNIDLVALEAAMKAMRSLAHSAAIQHSKNEAGPGQFFTHQGKLWERAANCPVENGCGTEGPGLVIAAKEMTSQFMNWCEGKIKEHHTISHKEKIRDQDEEVNRSEHETSVDETLKILEQIFADRQNPSAELFLSKFSLTGRLEEMRQMGNKVIRKHKKEKSELRTKWKKCAQSTCESALQMLHLDCTGCVRPQKGQMNEMLDLQVTCYLEKKLLELILPLRFAEEEEQAKDELQALGISENIVDGMRQHWDFCNEEIYLSCTEDIKENAAEGNKKFIEDFLLGGNAKGTRMSLLDNVVWRLEEEDLEHLLQETGLNRKHLTEEKFCHRKNSTNRGTMVIDWKMMIAVFIHVINHHLNLCIENEFLQFCIEGKTMHDRGLTKPRIIFHMGRHIERRDIEQTLKNTFGNCIDDFNFSIYKDSFVDKKFHQEKYDEFLKQLQDEGEPLDMNINESELMDILSQPMLMSPGFLPGINPTQGTNTTRSPDMNL